MSKVSVVFKSPYESDTLVKSISILARSDCKLLKYKSGPDLRLCWNDCSPVILCQSRSVFLGQLVGKRLCEIILALLVVVETQAIKVAEDVLD